MEDGRWKMEDGRWKKEEGGWIRLFKSRRDEIIIDDRIMTIKNPEGMTLL
jgi:hypothetical protein